MSAADWIDDLERKAKAATPGPWVADHSEEDNSAVKQEGRAWWDGLAFCSRPADAKFIAAVNPTNILRLIGQLRGEERKARGFAYDLRIAEAVSDQRAQEIDRLIEDNRRMRHGSLCPECNAKAWGERADLRRERDEFAAKLAAVEALVAETEQAGDPLLRLDRLRAALSAAPTDTTKETPC